MSQYLPKPYEPFVRDINVKVDLSNYATKTGIKNTSHVDTSSFELKSNLISLKTEVNKLDIDKLKSLQNNLSNLKNKVDKSNNINEVIMAILNLYFFLLEDCTNTKNTKSIKSTKSTKRQTSDFLPLRCFL